MDLDIKKAIASPFSEKRWYIKLIFPMLDGVVTRFCDIINVEAKEEISHGKYATKTRHFGRVMEQARTV
ncbi:MAG: hypothetical protein PHC64_05185, partial [Candidatus Gastranaerophilales bacterium]|nr:hypothetical protein [Candidatus Gastranaerophilales bacterium]